MGNSFGRIFRISTFGESHGEAIGVVIDGCPAGLEISTEEIAQELSRRRPGQSKITTQRKESDEPQVLSGIYDGKTTGMPIAIVIRNSNVRSQDYEHLKDTYRPSHADFTYEAKYGHRDHRGGGRSSARETANWVAAGAVAKALLSTVGIKINAFVSQIGGERLNVPIEDLNLDLTESNTVRCPDEEAAGRMLRLVEQVRKEGDTVGGIISCICKGVPAGLGAPVFNKLHADLGQAMLGINAVKGFEYGSGFNAASMRGSDHNDIFENKSGKISTKTNKSGGIQGGISNGEHIFFNIAFKPVATLMRDQQSVNNAGERVTVKGKGRHDSCVVPRAVPIVEAMAALVLADHLLMNRTSKHLS